METYLGSSFSLQMLLEGGIIEIQRLSSISKEMLGSWEVEKGSNPFSKMGIEREVYFSPHFTSIVGHEGTARQLEKLLGIEVKLNRQAVELKVGDTLIIAQPVGNRIAYGEEVGDPTLSFFRIRILPSDILKQAREEGYTRGYREGNPGWLDEEEAREEGGYKPSKSTPCPKCGKEINSVAVIFGIKPGDSNQCQC